MNSDLLTRATGILRDVYGYPGFRDGQQDPIMHVAGGGDALVLMSTGGGKSICFQMPGLLRSGTTLVVSPLISLMEDQVRDLEAFGISSAFLSSTQSRQDEASAYAKMNSGHLKFLYVSPERLATDGFLARARRANISLIAVDEAHCVSNWGHDFRDEYRNIAKFMDLFPSVPRMAVTATADEVTRKDIISCLGLREAPVFLGSFARENIGISMEFVQEQDELDRRIINDILPRTNQAGIVYCRSRKETDRLHEVLTQRFEGVPTLKVCRYHAGMTGEERKAQQDLFIRSTQALMVATVGFGMGINKRNIRYVLHNSLPASIEAYYQEIGRAGRDGDPSIANAYYTPTTFEKMAREVDASSTRESFMRMVDFLGVIEGTGCRQSGMLAAFGETGTARCGRCDNCLSPKATLPASESIESVSILLKTIKDARQTAGAGHYINVLRGRRTQQVLEMGHEKLPTFGMGREKHDEYWESILRKALACGLAGYRFINEFSSKLVLTRRAHQVLDTPGAAQDLVKNYPFAKCHIQAPQTRLLKEVNYYLRDDAPEHVRDIYDAILQARTLTAERENRDAEGVMPGRMVVEIATRMPASLVAAQNIPGMRPGTQNFLTECLDIIEKRRPAQQSIKAMTLTGFRRK